MQTRLLAIFAALFAVVTLVAGCSGSSSQDSGTDLPDATTLLRESADTTKAQSSAHLKLAVQGQIAELPVESLEGDLTQKPAVAAKGTADIVFLGQKLQGVEFVVSDGDLYAAITAGGSLSNFGPAADIYDVAAILSPDNGLANVLAALDTGVTRFDACLAGIGGCPHAPGASGNVASEDLAYMLASVGIDTGVDIDALLALRREVSQMLPGETLHGTLWRARYVSPSNRIVEKRGFLTKAEAEAWLTTEKSKLITGDWTDPRKSTVTVGSLAPAWLDIKKRTLKPSAYKPLETSWRIHVAPRWERVPLRRVVNGDIAAWLSEIDRSPSIVHRAYGVLNGILKQAVKDGRLGRNPATGIDSLPRRRTRRIRRYLTQAELRRVADASGPHRALVLTLGYCGLRWGEATALKVADVDLDKRRITVHRSAVEVHGEIHLSTPKTDASTRLVPLPAIVVEALRAKIAGRRKTDLVFPGPTGDYMRRVRSSAGCARRRRARHHVRARQEKRRGHVSVLALRRGARVRGALR